MNAGDWCQRTCRAAVTNSGADCACGGAERLWRYRRAQLRGSGFRFVPPILGIVPPLNW